MRLAGLHTKRTTLGSNKTCTRALVVRVETEPENSSPRRSQLDSCFIERGTFRINRLHRRAVIALHPWNGSGSHVPLPKPVPKERRDGMKLARHYQALLDSGKFENRAALARHLGVSRARVTRVLRRL